MKVYTSELEFLRDEVEKCHKSMQSQIQTIKDLMAAIHTKREWVGLTNKERVSIGGKHIASSQTVHNFILEIESALKEKNT
jgi:hypothetical protein